MSWLDWTILAIIAVSTLFSLKRGFVKEALSLLAWVAAFLISTAFAAALSLQLTDIIINDSLRYATANARCPTSSILTATRSRLSTSSTPSPSRSSSTA